MTPQRLTREQKKAATRQALLDAAATVFARRGLEGASLDEICEEAGFSRGAFYSNFSSKEQLFLEVLERQTTANLSGLALLLTEEGRTVEERIAEGGRVAENMVATDDTWCRLHFEGWVLATRDEEFRSRYTQRYKAIREQVAEMLEAAAADRGVELRVSSRELAAGLFALFEGYALQHVLDPDALADGFLARMFRLLVVPSEDTKRSEPTRPASGPTPSPR